MTRSFVIRALLGALLLGAGTSTAAQAAPITGFASLLVGGQGHDLALTANPTKSTRFFVDEIVSSDAFDIHVTATLDAGAFILFGINVVNFGVDPLNVLLALSVDVLPVVDPTIAFSSLRGTLNAGQSGGVTLGVGPSLDPDGDGVDEILTSGFDGNSLGIDVGLGSSTPGLYGPFSSGLVAGPTGPLYTVLQSNVAFSITGGGDVADLQGITSVQAVPEPASLGLVGLGLVALVKRLRRHRRSV